MSEVVDTPRCFRCRHWQERPRPPKKRRDGYCTVLEWVTGYLDGCPNYERLAGGPESWCRKEREE